MTDESFGGDDIGDQGDVSGAPAVVSSESKGWAAAAHLGPLVLWFLAPLIIWLIKREEDPYVEWHAKEALNFQITLAIGWVVGFVLLLVIIGVFILIAVGLGGLVLMIIAGVKAANGERWPYPINIRFIK